jgi:outer membrane receptor for ferrienterochelin and colicins
MFQARLTYSTGFRAPQAYDEDLHVTAVGGEGVLIKLAEGLREERSNSFSGSVDYTATFGHWQANVLVEGFYTGLNNVFVLEDIGHDANGYAIKERRNGSGARVYGANLDAKIAHGKEAVLSLGFTAQRSRYNQPEEWSEGQFTSRMMRTPDYYGYFTFTSAPVKNFDFSLSGTYTGEMIVPHYAGYIVEDQLETTPHFFDLNLKLNYTFVLHDHIKLQVNTGVQNILNHFQPDLDRGEFRDSGYFYGPTQPRTVFVGFKIAN